MISAIISRLVILVFGTLYPAYASYKAVRTKNLKEYVKWMMYWIVFALFTCTETFTDVFLSWFPFYYEVKIVIVLWLLSPATKGSSILYRKFVHPALCRREQEIDEYIAKAKDQGYHTVLNLGTKGVNYATTVIMQTAIKGGGGLVQQLRKSYSLSDLAQLDAPPAEDTHDHVPQLVRRAADRSGYNTRRSASESTRMYFPEVDVEVPSHRSSRSDEPDFSHIKSSEDISSGYSSADNSNVALSRTGSTGARTRARARGALTNVRRPQPAEDSEVIIEELHEEDSFDFTNMPPLLNMPSPFYLSRTNPPFIYQYVGDQVKIIQMLGTPVSEDDLAHTLNNNSKTNALNANKDKNEQSNNPTENNEEIFVTAENGVVYNDLDINSKIPQNESREQQTTREDTDDQINVDVVNETVKIIVSEIKSDDLVSNKDTEYGNGNTGEKKVGDIDEKSCSKPELPGHDYNIGRCTELLESTSLDTSTPFYDNDSADSDDEASFGTPEDSPKMRRKSPKGRYGKGKAPPPPPPTIEQNEITVCCVDKEPCTVPTEIKNVDINLDKIRLANPIAEKKRKHKSKSPNRPRSNASTIGKLLQLPGKLAFWHSKDKSSNKSSISDDDSRRSSIIEITDHIVESNDINEIMNKTNEITSTEAVITEVMEKSEDQLSFKDASDFESEVISHDILEKSDALQKLIDAKIESHPEYKFISLSVDDQTTSKSTEV